MMSASAVPVLLPSLSLLVQWAVWCCKWRASLVGCCLPVLQSSLSLLCRYLTDLGVPENWLAVWLNLVYVLETVSEHVFIACLHFNCCP